jgi:uncharacterized membrane protein YtjA (UPF0391 family)
LLTLSFLQEGTLPVRRPFYGLIAAIAEAFVMIKWAIIFAIIALVAGALGFSGVAGAAMGIAKVLFWIAVIIAVIFLVLGVTIYRKIT